jgi:predicted transcriptional regulator
MTKEKKKQFRPRSIKATDEDWERWQRLALKLDVSLSQLIRQALRQVERREARRDQ